MSLQRSFRILVAASTLWAFLMLASTGAVHPAVAVLFGVFFLGALAREKYPVPDAPRLWRIINIAVFAAALYGWFGLGRRLDSVVYMFLYLALNRVWTAKKNRDYMQLFALTFFIVLAAAVSTSSIGFAPMIAVYVFLIVATLLIFTMQRDLEATFGLNDGKPPRAPSTLLTGQPVRLSRGDAKRIARMKAAPFLTRTMLLRLGFGTGLVCVFGLGLFFIIPRLEAGAVFEGLTPLATARKRSGFGDNVDLGGLGEIQNDPTIVMRVVPVDPQSGEPLGQNESGIRLRGTALESWDGRRWQKAPHVSAEGITRVSREVEFNGGIAPGMTVRRHRIVLEPVSSTRYLFLPDRPIRVLLERDQAINIEGFSRVLRLGSAPGQVYNYQVESVDPSAFIPEDALQDAAEETRELPRTWADASLKMLLEKAPSIVASLRAREPQRFASALTPDRQRAHLELPNDFDALTIRQVAQEWTGDLENPFEIARAIERRLKETFAYTLDTSDFTNEPDHLTRFLRSEQRGHCEYFATAMALLLRARGIPSRVVNGYLSDEWSPANAGYWVVRQENAHSWVEAHIGSSWITFDPTPASGIGLARNPDTIMRALSRWGDAVKLVWYQYVLDYDVRDQQALFGQFFRRDSRIRAWRFIDRADVWFENLTQRTLGTKRGMFVGVLLLALLIAGFLLSREWLAFRRRKASAAVAATPRRESPRIEPYLDILRRLERDAPRPSAETPRAYARRLAAQRALLRDFAPLTETYYGARFNGTVWTEAETRRARALLESLDAEAAAGEAQR